MKHYALFACNTYYPLGGWQDFRSWHDTVEEAVDVMRYELDLVQIIRWHVVDTTAWTIVKSGRVEEVNGQAVLNIDEPTETP